MKSRRANRSGNSEVLGICGIVFLALATVVTASAQVTATPPYTVSVFATSVPHVYYQPDSIAVWKNSVFVGYGNNAKPDGSSGFSTIVEYAMDGTVLHKVRVRGHNDGLKVDPKTNLLWALQNEDARPNLVIINPSNWNSKTYTFAKPAHGGGYDDMAFIGNDVYISASNPSNNPNTQQAIVKATLNGNRIDVSPVLLGDANATDITSGNAIELNLQDPDSMITDMEGDLVLDSQADGELVFVHNPGAANQKVFRLRLSEKGKPTQIDDTVLAYSSQGLILVSDRDGETVYSIQAPFFGPSEAYSAGPTFVGRLNTHNGALTPVVSGMVSPHGMTFIGQ
ncbi:MAG TPA: hypothetical protein VNZ03_17745 [Terriglobales bacterium]|jgi:hypothetical protein|nr:hypothetical protein [Terriglobales bacterium]